MKISLLTFAALMLVAGWELKAQDNAPAAGAEICTSSRGVYLVSLDHKIYLADGPGARYWQQIESPFQVADIATDGKGRLLAVAQDNKIYLLENKSKSWKLHSFQTPALRIAAAPDGSMYLIGTDREVYKSSESGWQKLPGKANAREIEVEANGKVWILTQNNDIAWFNGMNWNQYPGPKASDLSPAADGTIFLVGLDAAVYEKTQNGWQKVEGIQNVRHIAMDIGGNLWQIAADNHIRMNSLR